MLGILGGMGPAATADFMQRLVTLRAQMPGVARDQDHLPVMVYADPRVPDRNAALFSGGASPLPMLMHGARILQNAGAQWIAMPCNTAHYWADALADEIGTPLIHIAQAALDAVRAQSTINTVGLLATTATVKSRIYQARGAEFDWLCPSDVDQEAQVMRAVYLIKAGKLEEARVALLLAASALRERGAQTVILGCTEIPLALNQTHTDVPLIDATHALAVRCVGLMAQLQTRLH